MAACDPIPHLPDWNPPTDKAILAVYDEVTGELRPLRFGEPIPPTGLCTSLNPTSKEIENAYYGFYLRLIALEKLYCTCICPEPPEPTPTPTPTPTSTPEPNLIYFTSTIYPILSEDSLNIGEIRLLYGKYAPFADGELDIGDVILGDGTLIEQIISSYERWAPESLDIEAISMQGGTLQTILRTYSNWAPDSIQAAEVIMQSGTLRTILLSYNNWAGDAFTVSDIKMLEGVLE